MPIRSFFKFEHHHTEAGLELVDVINNIHIHITYIIYALTVHIIHASLCVPHCWFPSNLKPLFRPFLAPALEVRDLDPSSLSRLAIWIDMELSLSEYGPFGSKRETLAKNKHNWVLFHHVCHNSCPGVPVTSIRTCCDLQAWASTRIVWLSQPLISAQRSPRGFHEEEHFDIKRVPAIPLRCCQLYWAWVVLQGSD